MGIEKSYSFFLILKVKHACSPLNSANLRLIFVVTLMPIYYYIDIVHTIQTIEQRCGMVILLYISASDDIREYKKSPHA